MWRILLIGLALASLASASEARISAVDVANRMIEANSKMITSFEGRFICAKKDRLTDGGKASIKLYESMLGNSERPTHKEQIQRTIESLKEDYKDGYADHVLEFSGVYVSPTKFSLFRQELNSPEKLRILFKANGEKSMQYFQEGKHALIDRCDVKSGLVRNRKNELGMIETWMGSINHIRTNEQVEIVEETTYMGHRALIVKQGPTEWSLGEFSITHTVLVEKGYLAARSEYRDKETGTLVRAIECSNIVEIQPGIWKPLEVVDTKYALSSYNFPEYQELEVDTIKKLTFIETPKVNVDIPEEVFDIVVPPGTTKVVDKTFDKPLVLEYDPCYVDTGAAYIEGALGIKGEVVRPLNDEQPESMHKAENDRNHIRDDTHSQAMEETSAAGSGAKTLIVLAVLVIVAGTLLMVYRVRHGS